MATVTRPPRAPSLPTVPAPAAESPPAPQAPVLDPMRPHFGDRVAFGVWVTCALFMAALLTYDTLIGLFR